MQVSVIVHVIGPDRPGLVEQLSKVIRDAGGNWEGSRLVELSGQFSGMVQVVIAEKCLSALTESLATLDSEGLHTSIAHVADHTPPEELAGAHYDLEVVGQDRQGIVAEIAKCLASAGVNVIELATDCFDAPWSGERIFKTNAKLVIPDSVELVDLMREIEEIAGDLMVELHASDLDSR